MWLRRKRVVPIALIVLCIGLLFLMGADDLHRSLSGDGKDGIPGYTNSSFDLPGFVKVLNPSKTTFVAKEVVMLPPLNVAEINGSSSCAYPPNASELPAVTEPVCLSRIEKCVVSDPLQGRALRIRVWCTNAGDEDTLVVVTLYSNGEPLGNAPLSLASNETSAVDFISPIDSSVAPTAVSITLNQVHTFGAGSNPTGSPLGGGEGYRDIITTTDPRVKHRALTTEEFLAALRNAEEGDVVYIDEQAEIDLTDIPEEVTIPAGVTVASNRGEKRAGGSAVYSFSVKETGNYMLWCRASLSGGDTPSFWVTVDGDEIQQWDPEIGHGWGWYPKGSYHLASGRHSLVIQWRNNSPKLDSILLIDQPPHALVSASGECNGANCIYIEAESGALSPLVKMVASPAASGGEYIRVSEGSEITDSLTSAGGRIFISAKDLNRRAALITGGEQVRITGLRIEGPDRTTEYVENAVNGVYSAYRNLEIDNCELSGWSGAAIQIVRTGGSTMKTGGYIHHNAIHHCQMEGLGYGIMVDNGAVSLIEANTFDYCRHAIAGTGVAGDGYEARYNIVASHFVAIYAHNFDMHGKPEPFGSGTIAGDLIWIHHNTFLCTGPSSSFPIFIQGVPRIGAYIDHNWFYYTQAAPVWQSHGTTRVSVTNNAIGPNKDLLEDGLVHYL